MSRQRSRTGWIGVKNVNLFSESKLTCASRGLHIQCTGCHGGCLGMTPDANIGDDCAIFESTHGTALKYAGQDKINSGADSIRCDDA